MKTKKNNPNSECLNPPHNFVCRKCGLESGMRLEEVIELCGNDFEGLVPIRNEENHIKGWSADPEDVFNNKADDKNPKKAVLKLLKLIK